MLIEVVYIWPALSPGSYRELAERFVSSAITYPAMMDFQTTVVSNGAPPDAEIRGLFSMMPNVKFIQGSNAGYDISGFQEASAQSSADLIVFFGSTAYVRKPGWLVQMAAAFKRHGPTQYGSMGNRGDNRVAVWPHMRTTGFWTTPTLFNQYPVRVTNPGMRFPFEHGPGCFTQWLKNQGLQTWLVTTQGEYLWDEWDSAPGGFHNGGQIYMLTGDRLTAPPYYPYP